MKERIITEKEIENYQAYLLREEKSDNTIEKYIRDVKTFLKYCNGVITKENVIDYKQNLIESGYAPRSINSMLASINSLFCFFGWFELRIKPLKLQKQIFRPEEKELTRKEYESLCRTAEKKNNERLSLIIQTICATGIRVSELRFITVEAVRTGAAVVSLKGKTRTVFLVRSLQEKLMRYVHERKITSGAIFITRTGKPLSRTNIWREMKSLCRDAEVNPEKVFPHNLRHLFARVFYGLERDIAKLADVLGHSSIETTRIYIISSGSEHRKLMETMRLII